MARDGSRSGKGVRSFLLGGVLGASAVAAGIRRERRRRLRRRRPLGLAAFESAPCYRESLEAPAEASPQRDAS
ncbi:MAG: hypothetical protein FJW96_12735 [Actinobacteria bacterium]|nr:hypothetical protein [Actinomycetota bacterium]